MGDVAIGIVVAAPLPLVVESTTSFAAVKVAPCVEYDVDDDDGVVPEPNTAVDDGDDDDDVFVADEEDGASMLSPP